MARFASILLALFLPVFAYGDEFKWNAGLDPDDSHNVVLAIRVTQSPGNEVLLHPTYFVIRFLDSRGAVLGYDTYPLGPLKLKPGVLYRRFRSKFPSAATASPDPDKTRLQGVGIPPNLLQSYDGPAARERDLRGEMGELRQEKEPTNGPKPKAENLLDWEGQIAKLEEERVSAILLNCQWAGQGPETIKPCIDAFLEKEPPPQQADPNCPVPIDPTMLVSKSELIVRARAIGSSPADQRGGKSVKFSVVETLKGSFYQETIELEGNLSSIDQFNSQDVPYNLGRAADVSCYAKNYKKDEEYLLFLRTGETGLNPYWASQSPANEQVHANNDPWVAWVREAVLPGPKH